ncbi:hypothetical protein [Streptomyces sp. NBC_01244]|uniref:hypothetical protein n=1 Tax=Streptomyces sp. NBC_01244 TaxID=2903797 RepID=UPI002E12C698|nr:hypothetical protein OG247_31100 [Streptomyces sp. NBC_01244]
MLIGEFVCPESNRRDVRPDVTGPLLVEVIPASMANRAKVCGSECLDAEVAEMVEGVTAPLPRV